MIHWSFDSISHITCSSFINHSKLMRVFNKVFNETSYSIVFFIWFNKWFSIPYILTILVDNRKFLQYDSVLFITISNLSIVSFDIYHIRFLTRRIKNQIKYIFWYIVQYIHYLLFCSSLVILLLILIENSLNILLVF